MPGVSGEALQQQEVAVTAVVYVLYQCLLLRTKYRYLCPTQTVLLYSPLTVQRARKIVSRKQEMTNELEREGKGKHREKERKRREENKISRTSLRTHKVPVVESKDSYRTEFQASNSMIPSKTSRGVAVKYVMWINSSLDSNSTSQIKFF